MFLNVFWRDLSIGTIGFTIRALLTELLMNLSSKCVKCMEKTVLDEWPCKSVRRVRIAKPVIPIDRSRQNSLKNTPYYRGVNPLLGCQIALPKKVDFSAPRHFFEQRFEDLRVAFLCPKGWCTGLATFYNTIIWIFQNICDDWLPFNENCILITNFKIFI